jgi:hypothetical protein
VPAPVDVAAVCASGDNVTVSTIGAAGAAVGANDGCGADPAGTLPDMVVYAINEKEKLNVCEVLIVHAPPRRRLREPAVICAPYRSIGRQARNLMNRGQAARDISVAGT